MMIRIECPCGHVGVVASETLPRAMTCSSCRTSRRVTVADGRRMASVEAVLERLLAPSAAAAE
jgi:hypothetical protein